MHSSSYSSSPGLANGESPKTGGVKCDAGSGGTISVNGTGLHPATPKASIPSFATIVSSSPASGRTDSPFSSSTKSPSSTHLLQKHLAPHSSPSGPSSPLGDNNNDNKNSFINSTSFTIGNRIAINTSTQSTMTSSSSAASPLSCMRNNSEGDTAFDNSSDDVENDQEDSESSDVEIYLDSNNSAEHKHVLSSTDSAYSPDATRSNQMAVSAYLQPHSPFDRPRQTKTGCTPINEDQRVRGRVLDQEKRGPGPVSVLGAFGNGSDAHTKFNLASNDSNDGTHNSSHSPLPSIYPRNQLPSRSKAVQQHATSDPPRECPPLPEMKSATQATEASLVDDSGQIPQYTQNPSSPIPIDLADLSINGGHFGGTLGSCLTTANTGANHQGRMGMIGSGSVNSARASISPTPYATFNGIFSSSASDSSLYNLADGAESTGSASENGTAFSNGCPSAVKTPNVYINGLAPHFPEDELFNLCNEFGPIRSVRTFTRHVKDSESGYGFVLFESVEDADKCITEIRRRYKNLHPTFSKQIHKIPGTNYAAGPSTSWNISVTGDTINANGSFKAKMESLHDPTSTNLYMEGLPLSIDEPTLAALVSPHRIVSSRFFQTRLSNPPRIIAFVRLETRTGAEEVIERLHGRMVRGWNDTGSRIAVRFADTSKQRDLRKERAQDGETSPSRLTIAEASLLNLRGQDFRSATKPMQPAHTGNNLSMPSSSSSRGFATSVSAPDFSSNGSLAPPSHSNFNFPISGNGLGRTTGMNSGGSLEMDYSLALGGNNPFLPRSRSPYAGQFSRGRETFLDPSRIDSSVPHVGSRRGHEHALSNDEIEENLYFQGGEIELPSHQVHGLPYGQHHLPMSQSVDSMLGQTYNRPLPVYTCSGYTPAEEYIMRAHAESAALVQGQRHQPSDVNLMSYQPRHVERGQPAPLSLNRPPVIETATNIAVGMRAYRAQASLTSPTVSSSTSANSISSLSSAGGAFGFPSISGVMTEEDFLAGDSIPSATLATLRNLHASRLSREFRSYQGGQKSSSLSPFLPVSSSTMSLQPDHSTSSPSLTAEGPPISPNPNDTILSAYQQQLAGTHMRSTTVPQHRSSATANGHVRGHNQHSSMSIPRQSLGTPQHASVMRFGSSAALVEESSGTIYECDAQGVGENLPAAEVDGARLSSSNNGAHHGNGSSVPLKTQYSSSAIFGDAEQSSPLSASSSLISPTLTYGSQTPATLSPPTPFFGSFNNAEGFDKNGTGEQQHRSGQKEIHG